MEDNVSNSNVPCSLTSSANGRIQSWWQRRTAMQHNDQWNKCEIVNTTLVAVANDDRSSLSFIFTVWHSVGCLLLKVPVRAVSTMAQINGSIVHRIQAWTLSLCFDVYLVFSSVVCEIMFLHKAVVQESGTVSQGNGAAFSFVANAQHWCVSLSTRSPPDTDWPSFYFNLLVHTHGIDKEWYEELYPARIWRSFYNIAAILPHELLHLEFSPWRHYHAQVGTVCWILMCKSLECLHWYFGFDEWTPFREKGVIHASERALESAHETTHFARSPHWPCITQCTLLWNHSVAEAFKTLLIERIIPFGENDTYISRLVSAFARSNRIHPSLGVSVPTSNSTPRYISLV